MQVRHPKPLRKGEHVYYQGDSFRGLFLVQAGTIRTSLHQQNGDYWVSGFHFPGDVIGEGAFARGRYDHEACALETASICVLPLSLADGLSRDTRMSIYELILASAAAANERLECRWRTLSKMSAEQRVAWFIVEMSRRMEETGKHGRYFRLPMTRNDIANFLSLAPETLSRSFRGLQSQNLIDMDRTHVLVINEPGLSAFVYGPEDVRQSA